MSHSINRNVHGQRESVLGPGSRGRGAREFGVPEFGRGRRRGRTEAKRLGTILETFSEGRQKTPSLARAVTQSRWRLICGEELGDHSVVLFLGRDELVVGVPSPLWRKRFEGLMEVWESSLPDAFGRRAPKRIRFRVVSEALVNRRPGIAEPRRRRPSPRTFVSESDLAEGEGRLTERQQAALLLLDDDEQDELRQIFARWMHSSNRVV